MQTKNFKLSKTSLVIIALVAGLALAAIYQINKATPVVLPNQPESPARAQTPPSPVPKAIPTVFNLPIPFTSQAPTANWDVLHNEACEEASAIMANAYLTSDSDSVIPASRVETEISNLTVWQDQHFGYHLDTTAQETAEMITAVYGLKAVVQNGYTLQDIKDQLNVHHVVILPINGQIIGNPNYKQPGPIYHMLVVRGYTSTNLITNDSGTRLGLNYPYAFDTLNRAGADWSHVTNTIDQTKKVMIIVSK